MEVINKEELVDPEEFTGLNLRLYFWKTSVTQLWEDNRIITGIGTGDSQNYLNNVYKRRHLDQYGYEGFDAHNQWIMTLLQFGIIGVVGLASIFISGLWVSLKDGNINWQFFAIVIFAFTLSESVLESNKGIVFFALFFCLLSKPATLRKEPVAI